VRTSRPAAAVLLLAALAAGCGGGGDGGGDRTAVVPPAATTPFTDQETLRRTAARSFAAWERVAEARLVPARRRLVAARGRGDDAARVAALAGYAEAARRAREDLVRIPMPIDAYDPAAQVANALEDGAGAADDIALALRAGRRPPAAAERALAGAPAAQRAGEARVRRRLGLPPAG